MTKILVAGAQTKLATRKGEDDLAPCPNCRERAREGWGEERERQRERRRGRGRGRGGDWDCGRGPTRSPGESGSQGAERRLGRGSPRGAGGKGVTPGGVRETRDSWGPREGGGATLTGAQGLAGTAAGCPPGRRSRLADKRSPSGSSHLPEEGRSGRGPEQRLRVRTTGNSPTAGKDGSAKGPRQPGPPHGRLGLARQAGNRLRVRVPHPRRRRCLGRRSARARPRPARHAPSLLPRGELASLALQCGTGLQVGRAWCWGCAGLGPSAPVQLLPFILEEL